MVKVMRTAALAEGAWGRNLLKVSLPLARYQQRTASMLTTRNPISRLDTVH